VTDDLPTNYSGDNYGYTGTNWSQIPVSGASTYSVYNISSDYQPTPPPDDGGIFKNEWDYVDKDLSGPAQTIEKIRLRIPEERAAATEIIGTGPDAAPKVVELLQRLGIVA